MFILVYTKTYSLQKKIDIIKIKKLILKFFIIN